MIVSVRIPAFDFWSGLGWMHGAYSDTYRGVAIVLGWRINFDFPDGQKDLDASCIVVFVISLLNQDMI
jgi:hypothetical protein